MQTDVIPHPIPTECALPWAKTSLSGGAALSEAVRSSVHWGRGHFDALAPRSWQQPTGLNLAHGGVVSTTDASEALVSVLHELSADSEACLIVEDDLRRANDPVMGTLPFPWALIDGGIVHWCDLSASSGEDITATIRRGASGYPLNAFVVLQPCRSFGFTPGGHFDSQLASEVASTVAAIVVSAFDAESFLVWGQNHGKPSASEI